MPVLHTVLVVIIVYKYISVFIKCQVKEPQVRIELTTARLQIACSTAELLWHIKAEAVGFEPTCPFGRQISSLLQ